MDLKAKLQESINQELNSWTLMENETVQSIIQKTFLWMWAITAIVFAVGYYMVWLIKSWAIEVSQFTIAFWVSIILWLGLVFAISWFWQKMSYTTLSILAILFAVAEWVWLTWVLAYYSTASIINAFAGAALLFIIMAIYGYITKTDLTKLGSMLVVWLITIITLSLLNMFFFHSQWFDLVLSIIWLLTFLWLTAWNLQTLKLAAQTWDKRLEIVFWVSLFLDFINIFLYLLRIFGSNND